MGQLLSALEGRNIQEHLVWLQAQIRAQPQKAQLRLALCHFLALRGEWARAQEQARQAQKLDPAMAPAAASCDIALRAEQLREAFWRGDGEPACMGGACPAWMKSLIDAVALDSSDAPAASALRERALASAPALTGSIELASKNGTAEEDLEPTETLPVAWISDGDARIGPVLELLTASGYGWLPLSALRRLVFKRPRHLVDLLWAPVEMNLVDGSSGSALVPVRYPGLSANADDELLVARRTDWASLAGPDQYAGQGQRVFITDAGDLSLLDLRQVVLNGPPEGAAA